jgi:NhaP-type Na+/H+ or K+/H+ antiporter
MDPILGSLLFFGLLILLVAWAPLFIERLPLSLPIICVLIGAVAIELPGVPRVPSPLEVPGLVEHVTEIVVLVALMGAGLKLDRPFGFKRWALPLRMIYLAMPLTIAFIAGAGMMAGLPISAALLLAAVLAPTDPVLASDVQVGPPKSGEEDDVRFTLTAEAGLNDGAAFPFVKFAVALAAAGSFGALDWWTWGLGDVLWRIGAGFACGLAAGALMGWLAFRLPRHVALASSGAGFVALGMTFATYAVTELANGYGFLAVFVAAVTFRSVERHHEYHESMHEFMDQLERLLVMVVLVVLGGAAASGILRSIGWADVGLALAVVFVIRPAAGWISLLGIRRPKLERTLISFFGIRGIGSFYYLAYATTKGFQVELPRLWAVTVLVVLFSIMVHGILSTPLMRKLDLRRERGGADNRAGAPAAAE